MIKRIIVASIVPYLLIRILQLIGLVPPVDYLLAWIFAAMSLPPISQLGLGMLFEPIKYFIEWKMKNSEQAKITPFSLRGNFAPVRDELQYRATKIVEGSVPKDLEGTYLRNGPNDQFEANVKRHHWFSGDGMIHAF
jgi:hypothetical protein